jgi:hypothetical protein
VALAVAELSATAPFADTASGGGGPTLDLRLTPANTLSTVSRRALVNEADSIWRQGRVQLRWLGSADTTTSGTTLRVLVTSHTVASSSEPSSWGVGELLRFNDSVAIAVASISGARRIVDVSGRMGPAESAEMRDHRLGVVLGRAVAHEIGHYVLQTDTHAASGLMRGTIEAHEFADLRTDAFQLDRAARAHVASVAASGTGQTWLPSRPFSYRIRYPSRRGPD